MIISIWVFFMLGDHDPNRHGTPYIQAEASALTHDTEHARNALEELMTERFHHDFPGAAVERSGWVRQAVRVMGDD